MSSAWEKLGRVLVERGFLSEDQLASVLREANAGGSTLADVIVSRGYVPHGQLTETLQTLGTLTIRCPQGCGEAAHRAVDLGWKGRCGKCGSPFETADPAPSRGSTPPRTPTVPVAPPEVAAAARDPKRVLGKYTLVAELGRGGMAVVYKAWDNSLQQFVALKLIRTQDLGLADRVQDRELEEFLREARTAAKLQHPNIVRIFEVGSHEDRHYLSMQYIEGRSLAELLKAGPKKTLPFYAASRRFLKILREVAEALDHAHHHRPPIVHRDIKPQNILVDADNRAFVVDFGIAKEMKAGPQLTVTGIAKGTPCYMAPEQATGKPVDPRTDVHALGAVLYEFLAGRPPFTGPTERDILNDVAHRDPEPPSQVLKARGAPHAVLPDLERICLKALRKEKDARYPSARAFADDLDRFTGGRSVEAQAVRGWERGWRWARRNLAVTIPVGVAAVLAVVAGVALFARPATERIVERKSDASAAAKLLDPLVAEFHFARAVKVAEEQIDRTRDVDANQDLRQRVEELRLQDAMFQGLLQRIQKGPRDLESLQLKDGRIVSPRLVDAMSEALIVRVDGKVKEIPWSRLAAPQFAALVREVWPDLEGRPALGLGVWCIRNGLVNEAAQVLRKPGAAAEDPQAKRILQELSSSKTAPAAAPAPDPAVEENVARLRTQALEALAAGDLVVARARYERAITLKPGDEESVRGLGAVAKAEAGKRKAAPAAAPPAPKEEPVPVAESARSAAAERSEPSQLAAITYFNTRPQFVQAVRDRNLAEAARVLTKGLPAALRSDFARLDQLERPAVEALLGRIEDELERTTDKTGLSLRAIFDRRDLAALVLLYNDLDAAIHRLAEAGTEVALPSITRTAEGTLAFESERLVFSLKVTTAGKAEKLPIPVSVFTFRPDRLSAEDLLAILKKDRERRKAAAGAREVLGELLLRIYEGETSIDSLSEWSLIAAAASAKDVPRLRLDDYRASLKAKDAWVVNYLDRSLRWSWSQGAHFDDDGYLYSSGTLNTGTGILLLSAGMRITARVRVESVGPVEKSNFGIGIMEVMPDGSERWNEVLGFQALAGGFYPYLYSYQRQRDSRSTEIPKIQFSADAWTVFTWDLLPDRLVARVEGKEVDTYSADWKNPRHLVLNFDKCQVRYSVLKVTPIDAAETKASASPMPTRAEVERNFDNALYAETALGLTRFIEAGKVKGDDYFLRGFCRYAQADWEGALADFGEALQREVTYPQYCLLFRWAARTRQGDAKATPELNYAFEWLSDTTPNVAWAKAIGHYLKGTTTAEALLRAADDGAKSAGEKKERRCEAAYFIGCRVLAQGDAVKAAEQFKACLDTDVVRFLEYKAARVDLERMKRASKPGWREEVSARLVLQVPEGVRDADWEPFGWSPDGAEASIVMREGDKSKLQWGKRIVLVDGTLDPCAGWVPGYGPVFVMRKGTTVRVAVGERVFEAAESIRDLVVAPSKYSVAYVADFGAGKEAGQYLVVNGSKTRYDTVGALTYNPVGTQELTATASTGSKIWFLTGSSKRDLQNVPWTSINFSPNGKHLGYAYDNGGQVTILIDNSPAAQTLPVSKLRVSNMGTFAAVIKEGSAGNERPYRVTTSWGVSPSYREILTLALNSSGNSAAYVVKDLEGMRVVRDGTAGPAHELVPPRHAGVEQPVFAPNGKSVAYAAKTFRGIYVLMVDEEPVDYGLWIGPPVFNVDGTQLSYGIVRGRSMYWRTIASKPPSAR